MRALRFLVRKEFAQIFRDHTMLRLLVAMPIIQLLVLSSAATFEVRRADLYLVDLDHSSASRGLVARLAASGRFRVADRSPSMAPANEALLDRQVAGILRVPRGFERDLVRTGAAPVQLVLNAEDGAAAAVIHSYVTRILLAYGEEVGRELRPVATRVSGMPGAGAAAQRAGTASSGIEVRARGWYNPRLDYYAYMVPGILVVLVTVVGVAITSMNIVREKEIGTLEQLNVTPITKTQFIAGKLIPFSLIALLDLALGLVVGRLVFDIPIHGSLGLIFAATIIYLGAALGLGLWISTVVQTQQQAMFVSFALNMVFLLMSGLFTPIASMPDWAQWIAELSPVKHFIVIMRAVLVKGAGPDDILLPLAALAAFGTAFLGLAVRQYSKTSMA